MADPNLITTCTFHGQEFLFKMNVLHNNLEILVTEKSSGEEWQCSYDATYVENLTHKTGNFKQFDIFVAMIRSGLLRTSESVSLDLLTYDDLEMLRSRKIISKNSGPNLNNHRRYLIITYVVEFDKIRYPLPLEYCGPPDPAILQATIRRLESELTKTKEDLLEKTMSNDPKKINFLQQRVDELIEENDQLHVEISRLTKLLEKKPKGHLISMQKAVSNLEKSVVSERNSHHELVDKLRNEKVHLAKELDKVKCSEKNLKAKLKVLSRAPSRCMDVGDFAVSKKPSSHVKTVYRRSKAPLHDYPPYNFNPPRSYRASRKSSYSCNKSYTSCKSSRSTSSASSNKYCEMDPTDSGEMFKTKARMVSRRESRESSVNSRCSSKARSKSRQKKGTVNVNELKKQLETIHKLITETP